MIIAEKTTKHGLALSERELSCFLANVKMIVNIIREANGGYENA